jgi:UDP-N-acetylglucosamine--N-acetylmuramyl-(pentapeptide) pyrophosphoryl-undecaprenol N-acetylglucosamine transferase
MRIVLTGGGSGGHFYPVLAVADAITNITRAERLLAPELYFVTDAPYNEGQLYEHGITLKVIPTGKARRYFSVKNFFDVFKTATAVLKAIWFLYRIYPDVVFGKGGYASFPTLFAARFLRIPVVIHESDTVPGRVNMWAGKFARRIAVSYPEAASYFRKDAVAWTGNPIRSTIAVKAPEGAFEYLKLDRTIPVILVIGGSLGAEKINDTIVDALPELVTRYQIIHQTGVRNFETVSRVAGVAIEKSPSANNYKVFPYLDDLALRMAAGAASLVVTRAGSSIFEIATWGIPSIVIPITDSNGDHQRRNAFSYARIGACSVIEESNLTPTILTEEIDRIIKDPGIHTAMETAAKQFSRSDSADLIAKEIITIALEHTTS